MRILWSELPVVQRRSCLYHSVRPDAPPPPCSATCHTTGQVDFRQRRWHSAEQWWQTCQRQLSRLLGWRAAAVGRGRGRGVQWTGQGYSEWPGHCWSGTASAVTSVWGLDADGTESGWKSPRQHTSSPQQPGRHTAAWCTSWTSAEGREYTWNVNVILETFRLFLWTSSHKPLTSNQIISFGPNEMIRWMTGVMASDLEVLSIILAAKNLANWTRDSFLRFPNRSFCWSWLHLDIMSMKITNRGNLPGLQRPRRTCLS